MTANGDGEIRRGAMFAAETDIEVASINLETLEWLSANRRRRTVEDNRPSIARAIGVSVTAIERIRHKRRKVIPSWVMAGIRAKLIDVLQETLREIEHDQGVYLQTGGDPRCNDFAAIASAAAHARALLDAAIKAR